MDLTLQTIVVVITINDVILAKSQLSAGCGFVEEAVSLRRRRLAGEDAIGLHEGSGIIIREVRL